LYVIGDDELSTPPPHAERFETIIAAIKNFLNIEILEAPEIS
tara:strand:+ start:186 stop:311 length:126 start_codon:yes stop_codon:yes gene_type:complete